MGAARFLNPQWRRFYNSLVYPADGGADVRSYFAVVGQSNAMGLGTNKASVGLTAVPSIPFTFHHALMANPPVWKSDGVGLACDDRKQFISTSYPLNSWGPWLAIANYLAANSTRKFGGVSVAVDGVGLEDHLLNAGYPLGGPALLEQHFAFIEAAVAAGAGRLDYYVYIQGEYDASASPDSTNYATNLATLRSAVRARFGSHVRFIVHRLSSNVGNNTSAVIRAAQEGLQNQGDDVWLTYGDQESLRDSFHYTDQGYKHIGDQIGAAILAGSRPTQRWFGAGVPGTKASTGTMTPTVPTSGRLGFLVIGGIGNTAYVPPAGWNLVASVHDDGVLTSARLQVYWRSLQPGDTVSIADLPADDAATAFVFALDGCHLTSPIDAFATAFASTATTAFSAPSATATGPGLALVIGAHEADVATAQLSGLPAGWVEHIDYAHTGGSGSGIFVFLKPVTAGATGTVAGTLATSTTYATATVIVRPA